jgi:hypothetical protein
MPLELRDDGEPHFSHVLLLTAFVLKHCREGKRDMRERAAEYVATHYPVYHTGRSSFGWIMEKSGQPQDGGKVQETYAKAIRALPDEPEEKLKVSAAVIARMAE